MLVWGSQSRQGREESGSKRQCSGPKGEGLIGSQPSSQEHLYGNACPQAGASVDRKAYNPMDSTFRN